MMTGAAPTGSRTVCPTRWGEQMSDHPVFSKSAKVYPMYVHKAGRNGRTKAEVDELARGRKMVKIPAQAGLTPG